MAIKMAIIGMGGMSGWHYSNITEHIKEVEIVAGYDINPETNAKRAKEWGVKIYDTPEQLYADEEIELVLIATTNEVHAEYAIKCMEAGKNVVCEKPVTMNVKELEEVIKVRDKTGKFFSIHQNRRWDPDYMVIKKMLADSMLRNPYTIKSSVHGSHRLYGWRAFLPNGGGLLLDWGVHLLDQALDLMPDKVVSTYAHLHALPQSEVDDVFTVMLRFESGCTFVVDISTNSYVVEPRWRVHAPEGTAIIEDWELHGRIVKQADPDEIDWTETVIYTAAGPTRTMLPRPKETTVQQELPKVGERSWIDYYKNVVGVLQGKAEQIVTAEQGLRVMKVIEALFESDRTGAAVTEKS
jgi:predicted dehydrogenase